MMCRKDVTKALADLKALIDALTNKRSFTLWIFPRMIHPAGRKDDTVSVGLSINLRIMEFHEIIGNKVGS